jgi:hypothetical protein
MTRRLPLSAAECLARCLDRIDPCLNEGMLSFWHACFGEFAA